MNEDKEEFRNKEGVTQIRKESQIIKDDDILKKELLSSVKKQEEVKKSYYQNKNYDLNKEYKEGVIDKNKFENKGFKETINKYKERKENYKESLIESMPKYETEWTRNKKTELIEIKLKKINQLFNSFDPSPFLEKDLDDDAFEYIVSSVGEYPLHTKQKIVIYLPKYEKKKVSETEIARAIHHFFEYKAILAGKNIKLKFQEGQFSLVVGLIFLSLCIFLRTLIGDTDNIWMYILSEGLMIGGWVAMWKPISDILYEWWPSHKEKKVYQKISKMEVELRWTD